MIGCDYASVDANKPPNVAAAKAAGISFAIIRGSYRDWVDPTFLRDAQAWRSAGVVVGGYMFFIAGASIKTQVEALRRGLGGAISSDLPPTIDVEFPGGIRATGLSRREILEHAVEAIDLMTETFARAPMVYTSARVWDGEDEDALDADRVYPEIGARVAQCPLWLARYPLRTRIPAVTRPDGFAWPPVPRAWGGSAAGGPWIHQYQGDAIKMPGFSATVDLNRFRALRHGDEGERVKWLQRKLDLAEGMPGVFDDLLDDAVRDFQRGCSLVADGVVGPRTFARVSARKS